jgi:hypothetical protein
MSIRYVDRWQSNARKPVSNIDCFAFRIDNATDFAALPTPTTPANVVEGSGTVSLYADVGSTVVSDDMTITGELQSDNLWHQLGGA